MKLITTVLMLVIVHSYSFSQENSLRTSQGENSTALREEDPSSNNSNTQSTTAQLTKESVSGSLKYTFLSPKQLTAGRVDQWEDRFKSQFSVIEDISMNHIDQSIEIVLPNTHTEAELLEILARFNYIDFEITN